MKRFNSVSKRLRPSQALNCQIKIILYLYNNGRGKRFSLLNKNFFLLFVNNLRTGGVMVIESLLIIN